MKVLLNHLAIVIVLILLVSFNFSKEIYKNSFSAIQNEKDSLKIKVFVASTQKEYITQIVSEESLPNNNQPLKLIECRRSKHHCLIGKKE